MLGEYLDFYTRALEHQPSRDAPFKLLYLDAFAGTGRVSVKVGRGQQRNVIEGSVSVALSCPRRFAEYHFVEAKRRKADELRTLVGQHPLRACCSVHGGLAGQVLPTLLARHDWRRTRGVLLLDPFGLQCDWALLERVAATRALDVFYLMSLSGLHRNATDDFDRITPDKEAALTRVLGTDAWRTAWYDTRQLDMFDEAAAQRTATWNDIARFTTARLRLLFPEVLEPCLLGAASGPPLFALYLAVSNPSSKARELARRAGRDILSKLR